MPDPRPQTVADRPRPRATWVERHAGWLLWVYWACLFIGTHSPRFGDEPPPPPTPLDPVLQYDKLHHAMGFGGLMVLVLLSGIWGKGQRYANRCLIAMGIAGGYAVLDELTQQWVPGRELDWTDILANLIGVLSAYVLAMLPARREQPRRRTGLAVVLVLLIPAIVCLMLMPEVIDWVKDVRRDSIARGRALHPLDHVFHGLAATLVSVLVIVAWPMASRRPRLAGALALGVLLLSAPAIEIAQHYTGRGVEAADARSHILGVAVAMIWWAIRLTRSERAADALPRSAAADTTNDATPERPTHPPADEPA